MAISSSSSRTGTPKGFVMFDRLPKGHIAFEVTDDSCEPLIRQGEWAIVDLDDREPADGQLFLRQYRSSHNPTDRRSIVEAVLRINRARERTWLLAAFNRHLSVAEMNRELDARRLLVLSGDGPFADEGEHGWYVRDLIVGRVIGILANGERAFAGPEARRAISSAETPDRPARYVLLPLSAF